VLEGYRWTPAGVAGLGLVMLGNVLVFARRGQARARPRRNAPPARAG